MLTIKDVLEIEGIHKAELTTDADGTNRIVKGVTIMEVPDISQWIKGGELIVTSFYSFTGGIEKSIDKICNLIKQLSKLDAAGIILKTDRKIPSVIIDIANEENFPIVRIPKEVTYLEVMNAINYQLFIKDQNKIVLENYIKNIIFKNYKSEELMIEKGKSIGYNLEDTSTYTITIDIENMCQKINNKKLELGMEIDRVYKHIELVSEEYKTRKSINNYILIRNLDDITLFIQSKNISVIKKEGDSILKSILNYLNSNYKNNIKIGISDINQGIQGIEEGYTQSKYAIKIGKATGKKQDYFSYKQIEIYSLIYQNSPKLISNIVDHTLGRLLKENELLQTLCTYFECDENIMNTSEKLFIHKNTLKYRLENIKSITGLDIKNTDEKVRLYIAISAYKMINNL